MCYILNLFFLGKSQSKKVDAGRAFAMTMFTGSRSSPSLAFAVYKNHQHSATTAGVQVPAGTADVGRAGVEEITEQVKAY